MRINLKQGESLTAVLAGAAATTNPNAHVEWADGASQDNSRVALSGATVVTLLSAPNHAGRTVTGLTIYNPDTAAVVVTIAQVIGSTSYTLFTVSVAVGATLVVNDDGMFVLDSSGQILTASTSGLANPAAFTNTVTTTDGVAAGTERRVGGGVFRQVVASTAITGATETETNFSQAYTMPANTLKAGTRVKIRAQGIHTATTDTEDHTILLKVGSTTVASKAAVDPADSDLFFFDFELVCRTAGEAGTMVGCGLIATGPSGTADVTAVLLASTAVDTTAELVIAVAIDRQASATDGDSARLDILTVDIIG